MNLYNIRKQLNMGIPLSDLKLRVTTYSRVSTDHEEQKSSLLNQVEHFKDMIINNPSWTYIEGYVDEGISGTTDFKRTSFMKMINDAHNDKFDFIITKEISRFSRNTLDSIKYTRELLNNGVAVLFVNDNINTLLPDSELRLTIMASMAQDEIRKLSDRVKFGMNRSIKNGHILGNDMLYGYKKDKLSGNLKIIEKEALIVKRIFKEYVLENKSLNQIVNLLNKENILTSQNKKWSTTTISRMIQNIKYKGYYCGKKSEVIDYMTKKIKHFPQDNWIIYKDNIKIPPIIDEYLWNKANIKINSRKRNKKISFQNRYVLSSKIYCYYDNELFHRRKQLKANDDTTWICSRHLKNGKLSCPNQNIRQSEIYEIFKELIKLLNISIDDSLSILLKIYQNISNNDTLIRNLINKEIKIKQKKDRLLDLNIEGTISIEDFNNKNIKLNEELISIKNKLKNIKKDNNDINQEIIKNYYYVLKNNNSLLEIIISHILNKIIVLNNQDNKINLDIYLNLSQEYLANNKLPQNKEYIFKRGFNTTSTKRYLIKYNVSYFLNKKI